jgi:outer membrane cobalamin receptor
MTKFIFFLCLILFFLQMFIYANDSARVHGIVYDVEGAPLTQARVEILGSNIVSKTSNDGTFIIEKVNSGRYWLLFTKSGYKSKTVEIIIDHEAVKEINITLQKHEDLLPSFAEVITVTDKAPLDFDITLPAPKTTISAAEISQGASENLAHVVQNSPGIAMIGKGGYSLVPTVRGLARNHILFIVDGVKLISERRTGPSGSFINPYNIDHIDINRGPYSNFYGSDAIGGIINITTLYPRPYQPLSIDMLLGYKTVNEEKAASFRLSGSHKETGYLLELNKKDANEYSSPEGTIEQSQYSDYDIMFKANHTRANSNLKFMLLHYEGQNIGKAASDSKFSPTWYPRERNTILNVDYQRNRWLYMDSWDLSFYYYPSLLETTTYKLNNQLVRTSESYATVEGSNFGFKMQGVSQLGNKNQINLGIDYMGRRGVSDSNRSIDLDKNGYSINETDTVSLNDASQNNIGLFLKHSTSINKYVDFTWGTRLDYIQNNNPQESNSSGEKSDYSLTGYVGTIFRLTPSASIIANLGRAFRFPSLSELYYYGLTGRGRITGNPDLKPENSLNFDAGFRYLGESWYIGLYGFTNSIDNIIERFSINNDYFYENLYKCRISGIEGELYVLLSESWQLSANFHHMVGKELDTEESINDVPPSRLFLALKFSKNRWQVEPRLTFAARKDNPGSSEIPVEGYVIVDSLMIFHINQDVKLYLIGSNLLNQNYRITADEKGVVAPGRNLALQVSYSF